MELKTKILDEAQILAIRQSFSNGMPIEQICRRYNIPRAYAMDIIDQREQTLTVKMMKSLDDNIKKTDLKDVCDKKGLK